VQIQYVVSDLSESRERLRSSIQRIPFKRHLSDINLSVFRMMNTMSLLWTTTVNFAEMFNFSLDKRTPPPLFRQSARKWCADTRMRRAVSPSCGPRSSSKRTA